MNRGSVIDMLGVDSGEFIKLAAGFGCKAPNALALYRKAYRRGQLISEWARLTPLKIAKLEEEAGTIKFTLPLEGGLETETVILPYESTSGKRRNTLCVSSQVGCAMGCTFCETAQMGLMKNLTARQIIAQWFAARHELNTPIDNVVFMGMGEPMDNLGAVIEAIRILADDNGPAVPPSRITVSTVGRVQGIRDLSTLASEEGFSKLRLAVSINAPNDVIRSEIMPVNRAEPMAALMESMRGWTARNGARVLIEYVLIPGVNDALQHADELCDYLRELPCTVNVIPYNPRRDSPWPAPPADHIDRFVTRIDSHGQFVKRRRTKGRAVMAACGQLGNERIRKRRAVAPNRGR